MQNYYVMDPITYVIEVQNEYALDLYVHIYVLL